MRRFIHAVWFALLVSLSVHAETYSYEGTNPKAVIDVRTPEEFASGHVEGAINIPYNEIGARIATLNGLKKDDGILLYCRSGRRSSLAKQELDKLGYRKVQDGGAMEAMLLKLKVCASAGC